MKKLFALIISSCLFCGCVSTRNNSTKRSDAEIVREGFINCFDSIILDGLGNPVHCEASAVVLAGNALIIASDKEIPGSNLSPVFSISLENNFPTVIPAQTVSHLNVESFLQVRKIEDMTKEPSGNLCFATTGFDRIRDTTTSMDPYNSLLYWKEGDFNNIQYMAEINENGVKSSKELRSRFIKALATAENPAGPQYFKVEAICALPDSTLLFGIRETGRTYFDMEYTCIVLSVKYHMHDNKLTLDESFQKVYELKPKEYLGIDAGLSGIAYNPYRKEIYFSTSLEEFSNTDSARFSAYLWKIPLTGFHAHQPAQIIKVKNGQPLHINHKVEGITFMGKDVLFTVSDQDRSLSPVNIDGKMITRKPYQAVYALIRLKK